MLIAYYHLTKQTGILIRVNALTQVTKITEQQQNIESESENKLITMMLNTGFTNKEVIKLKKPGQSLLHTIYSFDVLYYKAIAIFLFLFLLCFFSFYNSNDQSNVIGAIVITCIVFTVFFYVCHPKLVYKCHLLMQRYHDELHFMAVGYCLSTVDNAGTRQAIQLIDPNNESQLIKAMLYDGFTAKDIVVFQQGAKQKNSSLLDELHNIDKNIYQIIAPFLFTLLLCITPFFFIEDFYNIIGLVITLFIILTVTYFISTPILVYKTNRLLRRYKLQAIPIINMVYTQVHASAVQKRNAFLNSACADPEGARSKDGSRNAANTAAN